jgi:hypothetical protein
LFVGLQGKQKAFKWKQTEFPEIIAKETDNWNNESNNQAIIKVILFKDYHV